MSETINLMWLYYIAETVLFMCTVGAQCLQSSLLASNTRVSHVRQTPVCVKSK